MDDELHPIIREYLERTGKSVDDLTGHERDYLQFAIDRDGGGLGALNYSRRDIIAEREAADKAAKQKRGRTEWKEIV